MTHSGYDRLLMGSPLRLSGVSKAIAAGLLVIFTASLNCPTRSPRRLSGTGGCVAFSTTTRRRLAGFMPCIRAADTFRLWSRHSSSLQPSDWPPPGPARMTRLSLVQPKLRLTGREMADRKIWPWLRSVDRINICVDRPTGRGGMARALAVKVEEPDTRTVVPEAAKKMLRQSGHSKLSTRNVAAAA